MLDIVGKGHGWKTIGDDRGFIEDTGCHPVPIRLQWCKQISRPDSKAGEEEYEPDSSEIDSIKDLVEWNISCKRYRSLGGCRWMPCYILQLRYAKDSHPAGNTSGNLEP